MDSLSAFAKICEKYRKEKQKNSVSTETEEEWNRLYKIADKACSEYDIKEINYNPKKEEISDEEKRRDGKPSKSVRRKK